MVLLIRPEEHTGLVGLAEAVDSVEEGFAAWGRDPTINIPRQVLHRRIRLAVHQSFAPAQGAVGIFAHAGNGNSASLVWDMDTGQLQAIVLGRIMTGPPIAGAVDLRTPATSAVGTKHLARPDARTVGVIGSGRQARGHLAATAAVRPIQSARVYSRTPAHREAYADEMAEALGMDVRPVGTAREAVEGVDVVLVMTDTAEPVLFGDWLEPGQHVTSVMGGNLVRDDKGHALRPPRRDLDDGVIERSDLIVINSRAQAEQDSQGDVMLPIERGILTWERVGELGELLTDQTPGRTSRDQITLYKNNAGQGVADVALAALVLQRARERGLGTELG